MGSSNAKELPKLSQNELHKLSRLTGYPVHKVQLWYNSFIADCPKGSLTKKQFKKFYKQFYPHGKPNKFSDRIFDVFDRNKDNKIDFEEFLFALNVTIDGNIEEKLKCAFEMYDVNGDGKIDRDEMKVIVNSIFDLHGEDNKLANKKVETIFEKLDSDNDGYLTLDEFIQGCIENDYLKQLLTSLAATSDVLSTTSSEDDRSTVYSTSSSSSSKSSSVYSSSDSRSMRSMSSKASSLSTSSTASKLSTRSKISNCSLNSADLIVLSTLKELDVLTNAEKLYSVYLPMDNYEQRLI